MVSICRISVIYNEIDIIERNVKWYSERGIPNVILDNGSNDGTYELCQSLLGKDIIALERVPFDEHDRELSLRELGKITPNLPFEYLLLADADEFYEPSEDVSLKSSLDRELNKGYNIVRFNNMEFWMTEDDDLNIDDPLERIRYYSFFDNNRFKLFPNHPKLDFWSKLGHVPILPEGMKFNLSPNTHISRHYKFRSLEQGYAKINRIKPPKRRNDISFHYALFSKSPDNFIIPSDLLTRYEDDSKWNLERNFNGKRMSKEELMKYLGLNSIIELEEWFISRGK